MVAVGRGFLTYGGARAPLLRAIAWRHCIWRRSPLCGPPGVRVGTGCGKRRVKVAAGQIKQINVSRRTVYRLGLRQSLYEKVASPIPVSPDRYPTGLASSAAGSFPRVGRT